MIVLGEEAKGFSALRNASVALVTSGAGCAAKSTKLATNRSAPVMHALARTSRDARNSNAASLPTTLSTSMFTSKNKGTAATAKPHCHAFQPTEATRRPATPTAETINAAINRNVRPPLIRPNIPPAWSAAWLIVFFTTAWYVMPTASNTLHAAQTTATHQPGAHAATRLNKKSNATTAAALIA